MFRSLKGPIEKSIVDFVDGPSNDPNLQSGLGWSITTGDIHMKILYTQCMRYEIERALSYEV
jgi:hypothetical protein